MHDKIIKASVRDIVEFIMKSGSIDNRGSGGGIQALMQDGIRLHQIIQRKRKKEAKLQDAVYESEVKLSYIVSRENYDFYVEGRADGIWEGIGGDICVEEIKSTVIPLDRLSDSDTHWHWGQAKCYAFMLCEKRKDEGKPLDGVFIKLIYVSHETEETREFENYYTVSEITEFFDCLVQEYLVWVDMDYDRKCLRDKSIKQGVFPYNGYRKGQREFAVMAYRAIERNKKLYIEAPTGTGKTISALFPAVKALAEEKSDKFFYLTAKTITRQAAEQALHTMKKKGYFLSTITLTAKDKICITGGGGAMCNPDDCIFADGHYDRVNGAVADIIEGVQIIGRDDVTEYAKKHSVCPHEFQLDISNWTDGVVCDYNYAFDPKVQLKRFFGGFGVSGKYAFLVDEAHNLVDRAREMFSAVVAKSVFLEAGKTVKGKNKELYKLLREINSYFLDIKRNMPEGKTVFTTKTEPKELYELLITFIEKTEIWFSMKPDSVEEAYITAFFSAIDFVRTSENYDERFSVYIESVPDVTVKLLCLDPSYLLSVALTNATGSVFFSATLTPTSYFRRVLGGTDDDYMVRLPSPYDRANICVFIDNTISTRYKDRENGYERIADCLYTMIRGKKGNYFAFFSSYVYLDKVFEIFSVKYPSERTLVQGRDLGEQEREEFLSQFDEDNKEGLLAFAVMGGIFSEGVDLAGERLIGAAIVGVGLPLVSEERDVILKYYDKTIGNGFDYSYLFPGMNKVLQAAGRVIRSETDRGIILLIDDRFVSNRYESLFPYEWMDYKTAARDRYSDILDQFWGE